MPKAVVNNAQTQCTFGASPGKVLVQPMDQVNAENQPFATIMDFAPMKNVTDFGMCKSMANPTVAAATAAANGVLQQMKCIPVIMGPWKPGSLTLQLGGKPALNDSSMCNCAWLGVITITNPGTTKTEIP